MSKLKQIIKLHKSDDNTVILFNVDEILYVNIDADDDTVCVHTYTDDDDYYVNESPDKILALVNNKFIKCHRVDDNAVELFNPSYMITVTEEEDGTTVYLENVEMVVNETPEKIYNNIMKVINGNKTVTKPSDVKKA